MEEWDRLQTFCPKKMDPIWEQNLIMLLPCFLAQLSFQDNLVLLAYWTLYVFSRFQNDSSNTHVLTTKNRGFPGGTSGKEPICQWSLESERSAGGGQGNPLQYSCLENPMDRGAWHAAVHGVTKNQTWLKRLSTHAQPWKMPKRIIE